MSDEEFRLHERAYSAAPAGRSTYTVTCPFCNTDTEVRAWALAGSGKKCECGALHTWYGTTKRRT